MIYIKQAIDIINALGQYDYNEYSQLVYFVLKEEVRTKKRLSFLIRLLTLKITSNAIIAYDTSDMHDGLLIDKIDVNKLQFVESIAEIDKNNRLIIDLSKENGARENFALLCIKAAGGIEISDDDGKDGISKIEDVNNLINEMCLQKSIITKLVCACVKICSEQYNDFFSTYSTYKGLAIYTYLIKSTLIGEFLSLDDFSKNLKTILHEGLNSQIDETKEDRIVPPVLKLVENIIFEYTKFCNLKFHLYKEDKVSIVPNYYELEEKEAIYKKLIGVDTLLIKLHVLFQFALKIAAIDLCYYATKNNFQVLIDTLFHNYRIKYIYDNQSIRKDLNLLRKVNPEIYNLLREVLLGIEFKASVLVNGILDLKQYAVGDNDIRRILESYKNLISQSSGNPVISKIKKQAHNALLQYFETVTFNSYEGHVDIFDYDSRLKDTYDIYLKEQNIISDIQNTTDIQASTNKIEILSQESGNKVTPGFFSKIILIIHKKIKDRDKDYDKWLHIHRIILRTLRNYIQTYKDLDFEPLQIRPLFYDSFYIRTGKNNDWKYFSQYHDCEQDNNKSNEVTEQDKSIFFASFQSSPIDIQCLENIFFKYNNQWHEIQDQRITNQIAKLNKLSKVTNDIRFFVNDLFTEERKRTIQLLGIFGAMLAFVSSVVGMQKIVNSAVEFAIFSFTYILGLLIFVVTIFHISVRQQKSRKNQVSKAKTTWHPIWIIIVLLAFISGLLFYINNYSTENNHKKSELVEDTTLINHININK